MKLFQNRVVTMKTLKILNCILASLALLLAGCAHTPQQVRLAPIVNVSPSVVDQGIRVTLGVLDGRPSRTLGHYGAINDPSTEITTSQDIAAIVKQEIIVGMRKKGFVVSNENVDGEVKLTVAVKLLEYSTAQGGLTDGVNIKSALKVVAIKNNKQLEKMYRIDNTERVLVAPSAETNERWINDALSDVLRQFLDDKELSNFLAK